MLDLLTKSRNLKLQYSKSSRLTPDVFNSLIDLIVQSTSTNSGSSGGNSGSSETALSIRNKLQTLFGDDRLDISAIKNIAESGASAEETALSIRNKLQTLTSFNRLDSSAIKNLVASIVTYRLSDTTVISIQEIIDQILIVTSIINTNGEGTLFLNDKGEYSEVVQINDDVTSDISTWSSEKISNFVISSSIHETPLGIVDGVNREFIASSTFHENTLVVFLNGLKQNEYVVSDDIKITFNEAPKNIGFIDLVEIQYIVKTSSIIIP